jgi:hypothetical protein
MMALALAGCSSSFHSNGKTYEPYGLVNQNTQKSDKACYEISFADVAMGVIFIESIIVPIYIVGWDMYEPVKEKKNGSCNS